MASVRFHTDSQQNRVVIPSCRGLPPNPHIGDGLRAIRRPVALPSETASINSECPPESQEDKSLRYSLLSIDQRSFLTQSAAADLQAAHIINTVRLNAERKQQVEALLRQQKIYLPTPPTHFVLDTVPNAILLEANLHIQWDLYGTFCFVPAEQDAIAMLNKLRTSNEKWRQWQRDPYFNYDHKSVPRPLNISRPPFNSPHWEVVILYPHAMLPNGQPLPIAENPSFYHMKHPLPMKNLNWKLWVASGDRLSSYLDANEYHEPFIAMNVRDESCSFPISSLAMVINGYHKLNQFVRKNEAFASDRVKNFERLMSDLVTEIFFVPSTEDGYVSVAAPPAPPTLPPPIPIILPSSTEYHHTPTLGGLGPLDKTAGSGEVDVPEVPDADGLTDSEFQLLAAKAVDPHLNAKERADSAVMMLFGTHGYADPHIHR